ncbi:MULTISPECIES: DUF995 domain-containing protein [Thauera]|jgi:hypothetical protein|uniref:DUF995 domain-containing protein n=1 Tax=Thauera aminoaromatica S2 TaxID=1234381 RepID=N6ZA84_THASP|nr:MULTISPECIES: DUF995 domain-containing protein [Thauera]OPZ05342.1 MAG: hypothetical protein BWZ09_01176 [Alphaproteobacteria bacterium ADurb.BinA305]TMW79111.1 DUF995 domain-containing protein [Thauera sp. UPWRP]HMX14848.1 DUF995 domain-containing protein [Thauera aminoaromatica]HNG80899.1 DUF995 domain-containing protein [Burkholderiaceae bacterium]ENO89094.1 hypothetical protein C665_00810 [Thauera aminoaromatica S2]
MNRLLACAAAALLLSACASTEKELADKGMKPLDAAKVRTLLSGNTATGTTASGSGFMIYNAPDGTTRGKSGNSSDTGKWDVTADGQHCNHWTSWRGGERRCARLYEADGEIRYFDGGNYAGRFKIEQGNPYKL